MHGAKKVETFWKLYSVVKVLQFSITPLQSILSSLCQSGFNILKLFVK